MGRLFYPDVKYMLKAMGVFLAKEAVEKGPLDAVQSAFWAVKWILAFLNR